MSHEIDMSNGRANFAFVGEPAWHRLGDSVPKEKATDLPYMQKKGGLDWQVLRSPALYEAGGKTLEVEAREVLYRSDTHAALGVVSPSYKIVQPEQVLEFYRNLVEENGFYIETVGSLYGGKKIWALANTGEAVNLSKTDQLKGYVLLATSFDGSMATTAQHTSVRVVCNNTLRVATADGANMATFNHRGHFDPDATQQLLGLKEDWGLFVSDIRRIMKKKVSKAELVNFFCEVFYPGQEDIDLTDGKAVQSLNKAMAAHADAPGSQNTLWGAVNAVTYMVDYNNRSRTDDSRLHNSWFGQGDILKARAFEVAKEAA